MNPIDEKYHALGGSAGILGKPYNCHINNPETCKDGTGRYKHYWNHKTKCTGSIYWHPDTGAFEVHGAIRDKWKELGWEWDAGTGYPVSDERNVSDDELRLLENRDAEADISDIRGQYCRCSEFQKAKIYFRPNNKRKTITVVYKNGKRIDYYHPRNLREWLLNKLAGMPVSIVTRIPVNHWFGKTILLIGAAKTGKSLLRQEFTGEIEQSDEYTQTLFEKIGRLEYRSKSTGRTLSILQGFDTSGDRDAHKDWEQYFKTATDVLYTFNAKKVLEEKDMETIQRIQDDFSFLSQWTKNYPNPGRTLFLIGTYSDELANEGSVETRNSDFRNAFEKIISNGIPSNDFEFSKLLKEKKHFILGSAKFKPGNIISKIFQQNNI